MDSTTRMQYYTAPDYEDAALHLSWTLVSSGALTESPVTVNHRFRDVRTRGGKADTAVNSRSCS